MNLRNSHIHAPGPEPFQIQGHIGKSQADVLDRIAQGEAYLRDVLPGNVRLRLHGGIARLEVDNEAFARLLDMRADVVRQLKGLGFTYVALDLEGPVPGRG